MNFEIKFPLTMQGREEQHQEAWWFVHNSFQELWQRPDPTRGVPLNDLKYGKEGMKAVLAEASTWTPLDAEDAVEAEKALAEGRAEVAVRQGRLAVLDTQLLQIRPIYWAGSRCSVRRSTWFIVSTSSADLLPVPPVLELLVERLYAKHAAWVAADTADPGLVEKIESMERPFQEHMLVVTRGLPDRAVLKPLNARSPVTTPTGLESPPLPLLSPASGSPKKDSQAIMLVRGYSSAMAELGVRGGALPKPICIESYRPRPPPKHLVLTVHGIGQKLAGRLGYGFVRDVSTLREQMQLVADEPQSLAVLPILWRPELQLPGNYYADVEGKGAGFDMMLQRICLESVPAIRSLFSDACMDVLLYMMPKHRAIIMGSLVRELQRVYALFLAWNPQFSGKVHLIGHSLGSALLADLLTGPESPLSFPISSFFALGSPASLFFLLKHERPTACGGRASLAVQSMSSAGDSDTDADAEESRPKRIILNCAAFYNVFHPNDPIAYRMEPLIDESSRPLAPPLQLPYHKSGLTRLKLDFEERVSRAKADIQNSLTQTFRRLSLAFSKSEDTLGSLPGTVDTVADEPYLAFNPRGRIDFAVQETMIESAYLSAIRAHFSYWADCDVARFIVGEM